MTYEKLTPERIEAQAANIAKAPHGMETLQTVIEVMIGPGLLSRFATQQPIEFYIDDRVGGRPYPKRAIMQAVQVLRRVAELRGLDPNNLPPSPNFPNLGIF